ncbi:hypothetical protein [Aquabacterium sp.]|uniref:hypothetical protein n=1 Tax=Aquabacterium sp. TaxID=1872578 RepID=UPI003783D830
MSISRQWLYRIEVAVSIASVLLLALTLVEPMWIERLFDEAPDGGDGSLERLVAGAGFAISAVVAALLARRERRRLAAA